MAPSGVIQARLQPPAMYVRMSGAIREEVAPQGTVVAGLSQVAPVRFPLGRPLVSRHAAPLPGCSAARCSPGRQAVPLGVLPRGVADAPALASLPDHGSLWCYPRTQHVVNIK